MKERTCNIPPQGWWCSREAGHDGPCAARPMALDQARWFAMNIVDVGPERPSRAKWSSLRSLGQQVLRRLEMLGKLPSTGPTPSGHEEDCEWHCEQYPWECTCGLTADAVARKAGLTRMVQSDEELGLYDDEPVSASGTEARQRPDPEEGLDPKGDGPPLEERDAQTVSQTPKSVTKGA